MTQLNDMFAGTADPHVSGGVESGSTSTPPAPTPVAPSTEPPAPSPADLNVPANPVTEQPPAPDGTTTPVPEGAPGETPVPTPAATPQLSEEQLAQIAQATVAAQQASQPPPPAQQEPQRSPKQLTQQEYDNLFKPVRIDAQTFQGVLGFAPDNEQQVANFQGLLDGVAQNALRMAMYYTTEKLDETNSTFTQKISPLVQQQQAAAASEQEARFTKSYPDLAQHRDLLLELRDAAISRKMNFPSEQEAFAFIAQNARNILAKVQTGAQAPAPTGQAPSGQPAQTQKYTMPQTSMGGATGPSTTTAQGQANKSTTETLFS